ncbi:MAG: FtsX-like permease family protein [Isosphaeraceae bacterium]
MTALDRKMLRDLWQMKGQAVAIGLVIACGVATFVMSLCTHGTLSGTLDAYYRDYQFADVFAHLKRAPDALAARIAEIPGVERVQTRVVQQVLLDVPGLDEPALGKLVSIPERAGPDLNDRYLRQGRSVEASSTGAGEAEVLVSEGFALANHLEPGSTVSAVVNGRKRKLRVVGIALSPEYIYQIRDGDILPDDRRYGVLWMSREELAAAFDMQGAFNDVTLTLEPGAAEPEVLRRLDLLLEPFGGVGSFGRGDQPSHKFITNELNELRGMAMIVPTVFLAVAAFLLNVVVGRQVNTQREQIAALKAFGYTRWQVGLHYLKLVLMIVSVGVVLGTYVGMRLGESVAAMYVRFFHFPVFSFHLDPSVVARALLVSGTAAVVGTLGAVFRAVRLPPAEAMRPEPPASYRPTVVERLGLQRFLSPAARMILRHLERQSGRTAMSILGISLAVAMLVMGHFMVDALNYVMDTQFALAQGQDVTVAFVEPTPSRALSDLKHLPGVTAAEPFRSLAIRIRSGHHERRLGLTGLRADNQLYRLVDIHRHELTLPGDGVVLSEKLAEVLGVGMGDPVTVEVLEGKRPVRSVPVRGLISDFTGVAAYMEIHAVNRLMEEADLVSGAHLAVDPARVDELYSELKTMPRVPSVTIKSAALDSFRSTVAENLLRMRLFNVMFSSIIAAGVVYNCARIALAERGRELATLRVIGFTRAEISSILLGELGVVTAVAIPFGLLMGRGLAELLITKGYDTEMFRIPLVIESSTYGFAVMVTLVATVLSGLVVRRGLDRLDLVAVLKSKE